MKKLKPVLIFLQRKCIFMGRGKDTSGDERTREMVWRSTSYSYGYVLMMLTVETEGPPERVELEFDS